MKQHRKHIFIFATPIALQTPQAIPRCSIDEIIPNDFIGLLEVTNGLICLSYNQQCVQGLLCIVNNFLQKVVGAKKSITISIDTGFILMTLILIDCNNN